MSQVSKKIIGILGIATLLSACQTTETGGKVVDKGRGEIVISSAGNQQSALPQGRNDASITEARENLTRYVKDHPKDVSSLLSLAQLQMAQDLSNDAEETCHTVLLVDIKNAEAKKILAQVAIRRQNYDLALIFLTAVGGEQSKDSSVLNMLALIALAHDENGEAMRLWKAALALNPGDISVRMNMGVMYLKNRLLAQASTQFERILIAAPNHQDAMLHLAIIQASRGKNAEAITSYNEILKQDKNNQLALYNLAIAQKSLAQYDDAIETLKRFIKASPGKSKATDHAFALIDDLNSQKVAKGEKISDDDLQTLAQDLSSKHENQENSPAVQVTSDERPEQQAVAAKEPSSQVTHMKPKTAPEPDEGSVTDNEIEALENQLKAH